MKKTILCGMMLFSLLLSAQQQQRLCGFERTLEEQDRENPGVRQAFDKIVREIQSQRNANPSSAYNKIVNGVYEIPVVVHVIYPTGAAVGSTYNKTDAQIQAWLDRANAMYAGTYSWPNPPADFGTSAVFPIKLVLAKRDPNCNATTGIVRYNGGALTGYDTYGVKSDDASANGVSTAQIKSIAPHWPEAAYFNIYVISMFDGDTTPNAGLMGWAAFPNNSDANYESFMKSGVVTNSNDTTLAHEFGHAMGLYHTFQGGNYQAASGASGYCPPSPTGDCTKDNDKVCDTEVSGAAFFQSPPPTNSQINPCTSVNYQGVQYNIMNYTNSSAQKFTKGQGDRIGDMFMLLRSSLTTSAAATALPSTPVGSIVPVAATCTPSGLTNPASGGYLTGPISVKLGQINNSSAGMWSGAPSYYVDYTSQGCLMNVYTPLVVNQSQNVQVNIFGNSQSVRVWIDYNNNGSFEASELVASGDNVVIDPATKTGTFSASFTPPASAVLDTPLRMRVLADFNNPALISACGQLNYGQVEDYSVRLVNNLATSEVKAADSDDLTIYPNPVATGDKIFIKAKNGKNLKVSISDMSGRLVASPSVVEERNGIFKVNQQLEKGVYMIQVSNGKDNKTSKVIIK
ncbi:GEVED domain-containing protein [Chryseobacterium sp. PMSZPI]|uniref:GEVED domain-containing protein n=1 Tax=Chryseobacterium sp. PMSZPI TaxID=1033900 RepID=UPI000C333989|nr:GEVED domain-containing protein [Chryseobacterium sp. PMSZPI]PKF74693.1 secretion protein [Chryseobacterium sp. PMSZPI]